MTTAAGSQLVQWLCIQLTTQLSEMEQAAEGGEEKEEDEEGQADRVQEGRLERG